MGIGSYTSGYGGTDAMTVTGTEIGHLIDMKKAQNWRQGFGLLTVDKTHVKPEVLPIDRYGLVKR
jgi:hypothetical protein